MKSITETTKRSKKTRRLGPVRVLRPDQYEAFDVDSKLECIRALIPLGLMHVQEVLEEEVYRWVGERASECPLTQAGVVWDFLSEL